MNELRLSFWLKFGLHSLFIGIGFGLTVWVAGCESFDNPKMILPEGNHYKFVQTEVTLNVTPRCLERGAKAPNGKYVAACANSNANSCHMTVSPNVSNETLGHEFRHCINLGFHD